MKIFNMNEFFIYYSFRIDIGFVLLKIDSFIINKTKTNFCYPFIEIHTELNSYKVSFFDRLLQFYTD
jgi:hypothetical protein